MNPNLPHHYKDIADEMGISLYQRFSLDEASDFLNCSNNELETLTQNGSIDHIRVTKDNIQLFGYQLLAHLLKNTTHNNTASQDLINNPDRIIRSNEVQDMVGLSRQTIWRYEKNGKFPQRVKLGNISVGWKLNEIQDWIQQR